MSVKAEALIIKNMPILEDVYLAYLEAVGPNVSSEIEEVVEKYSEERGFACDSDLWDSNELSFGPKAWKCLDEKGNESWKAAYELYFAENGRPVAAEKLEGVNYWLSPFLGIGSAQVGFRFKTEIKSFGYSKVGQWKSFVQNHPSYDEISAQGFLPLTNGDWFLPWRLDPETLATAYANETIADALQPIRDALEKITASHELFVSFVSVLDKDAD